MRILTKNGYCDNFVCFCLFKHDKLQKRTQIGTGALFEKQLH